MRALRVRPAFAGYRREPGVETRFVPWKIGCQCAVLARLSNTTAVPADRRHFAAAMKQNSKNLVAMACFAAAAAGCAGGPPLPGLSQISTPDISMLTVGSLPSDAPSHQKLPSAEVYSRIARGANGCWFGPRGRLAATHILHADAAPSINGGSVDIVVHERATDQPVPWGYKAFRVMLTETAGMDGTPGAGGTSIAVENSKIPEAEAARMRHEVFYWAAGSEGCKADPALDKPVEVAQPAPAKAKAKPIVRKSAQKASAVSVATPAEKR